MNAISELSRICPAIASSAREAVAVGSDNPLLSLRHLEHYISHLTQTLLAFEDMKDPAAGTLSARLNGLANRGFLPGVMLPFFHAIAGSHTGQNMAAADIEKKAKLHLSLSDHVTTWFVKSYSPYLPPSAAACGSFDEFYRNIREKKNPENVRKLARKSANHRALKLILREDETRVLIDFQLRNAGWQADSLAVRYGVGARPEKGVDKAIAEWPTETGPADYALFTGLDLIGFIEAKKMGRDIVSDLAQSKRYAHAPQLDGEARFIGGPWNDFKAPFVFATNARPYLEQLKEKSGIWFLDVRNETNHPRPLQGWYSAEELRLLLNQDIPAAHARLSQESLDYLGLRDYQEKAIGKIEAALDSGQKNLLIAMATGTGKTRLAISLIYRLIKMNRFRRILYVVDRNALGEQTGDKFRETRLEDLKTFDQIFDFKGVHDSQIDTSTRGRITTVQALMRAVMYPADPSDTPSVGQYDCLIVDESHRGYTLDRELGEEELIYRDQNDYLSKYRRVIEYFDAVKIGLTATPAPHTIEIFGRPVVNYSYREAVFDGWLIDHEPPHQIGTRLAKTGIAWNKNEIIPVYDPATGQITNIEVVPDELKLEIDAFNKKVLTEKFNRTVIKELVKHLDPDGEEKTLVYAATDDHADIVVRIFKEEFETAGIPVSDEAIVKITGSIDRPTEMIRRFKNERLPNIAVTVDLLTTGIDVPEICNLVFLRRVKSRILFEQMLGRATRPCQRIGKDHFSIFDAVRIYEALEPVSAMRPVVVNPNQSVGQLFDELDSMTENHAPLESLQNQVQQIVGKLQRIFWKMTDDDKSEFKTLSGGRTVHDFIASLRDEDPEVCRQELAAGRNLMAFLDENRHRSGKQFISHHDDELLSHTRGYGDADKPEDYLNAFREFIITRMNDVPALAIVCQRPRDLTRRALKELKLILDQAGYTEKKLQVAWKEWTNEAIAADIISFIRRQALGDPLISHEQRIRNAMSRIYQRHSWNKTQRQWLERIEKQLLEQTILDRGDFDRGAFANAGGFGRLNTIFQGNFQDVLNEINTTLYEPERQTA